MVLLGILAFYIFFNAMALNTPTSELAVVEIMIVLVLSILAQTVVLVKIYENTLKLKK